MAEGNVTVLLPFIFGNNLFFLALDWFLFIYWKSICYIVKKMYSKMIENLKNWLEGTCWIRLACLIAIQYLNNTIKVAIPLSERPLLLRQSRLRFVRLIVSIKNDVYGILDTYGLSDTRVFNLWFILDT